MLRASKLIVLTALLTTAPTAVRAQSRDLGTYLLFGLRELHTKGPQLQSGDLGVNESTGVFYVSPHGQLVAPQSEVVADVVTGSLPSLCKRLFSNLVTRTMFSCGPPTAFTLPILPDPTTSCGFPTPFPACSSDVAAAKTVLGGFVLSLAPGTYGAMTVLNGGTLILPGGDYRFCSLRAARNANILVQGPTTIEVSGLVNLGNAVFLGPQPRGASTVSPRDIHLFVNGPMVHLAGHADVRAALCAPGAEFRVTRDAHLQGTFVANIIHTEHFTGELPPTTTTTTTLSTTSTTSHSTTTTSTTHPSTTTTVPGNCTALCGNGHIDAACHEQCDGKDFGTATCPGGSVAGAFLSCNPDCTINYDGCPNALACGDGVKQPFEECDPVALTPGCPAGQICGAAGTAVGCRCVQPETVPQEICGNCIDDDGNGLTDFEDPACCTQSQTFAMVVRHGRLRPVGSLSRLRLKTLLARAGLSHVNPLREDVFLQIRTAGGPELLCARMPAAKFMRMHGAFKFWDKKHVVPSAKGINDLTVKVRRDGSVRLRTLGKRVQMQTPPHGPLQVTVGFHDPSSNASNACSSAVQAFRTGNRGRLIAP
jgi:hypothetical protein